MENLLAVDGLIISQQKEWGEILTGFETKNRYAIWDTSGNELYLAAEEEGSTVIRWFLKSLRPFKINIRANNNQVVLSVIRPFRLFFHQLNIFDSQNTLLGVIQRRFSLLRRIYSVFDKSGNELFQLYGPFFHPWTFEIKKGSDECGKIIKKWSGLLKEGFTDADNFGVTFPAGLDKKLKAIILGAVFLIDFVHFENKSTK